MGDVTTTQKGIIKKRIDITAPPRRMQSEVAKEVQRESGGDMDTVNISTPKLDTNITIEKAIHFFENTQVSDSALATLYSRTAKWLRERMELGTPKKSNAVEEEEARRILDSLK